MQISGMGAINPMAQVDSIIRNALNEAEVTVSSIETDDLSAPAKMELSGKGMILGQLQQLSESDPDKFQEVMEEIAAELEAAAEEAEDEMAANLMLDMADQFRTAAETGDVSALQPPPPPPPPSGEGMSKGIMQYMQQSDETATSLLDYLTQDESDSNQFSVSTSDLAQLLMSLLEKQAEQA